jgi:hypothetical protein
MLSRTWTFSGSIAVHIQVHVLRGGGFKSTRMSGTCSPSLVLPSVKGSLLTQYPHVSPIRVAFYAQTTKRTLSTGNPKAHTVPERKVRESRYNSRDFSTQLYEPQPLLRPCHP